MKNLYPLIFFITVAISSPAQNVIIEEGVGVGPLQLGQSFEKVVHLLGFDGDLKTYEDYLSEEMFSEDPDAALECVLGFEYYVKYEHLLTLPVSYVFFKDNVITQIKVSSFPEYYFAIAKDTQTKNGLDFWSGRDAIVGLYGDPDLKVDYESFILNSFFYFKEGITVNLRENSFRSAHIYSSPGNDVVEQFSRQF